MCRVCWILLTVLVLLAGGVVYRLVISEAADPGADGRQIIDLQADERDFVLAEMRAFLHSVQEATMGISDDDMQRVVAAARSSGHAAQHTVPASLVAKLPTSFKKLGFDTHRRFDELALDAEQLGDREHSLSCSR